MGQNTPPHAPNNLLWQAIAIISAILIVSLLIGFIVAGIWGLIFGFLAGAISLVISARVDPARMIRLQRGQALNEHQAPLLLAVVRLLAQRAGLKNVPRLFFIPGSSATAFSAGDGDRAVIGIGQGLLALLNQREIVGVLAHEIMHIRNRDVRLLSMTDGIGRFSRLLAMFGIVVAVISIPFALAGVTTLNPLSIVLLILAPVAINLLQLALSRTREFAADEGAVRLAGDVEGLASALVKLDGLSRPWWWRVLGIPSGRDRPHPWLSTHPPTSERIARLRAMVTRPRLGASA